VQSGGDADAVLAAFHAVGRCDSVAKVSEMKLENLKSARLALEQLVLDLGWSWLAQGRSTRWTIPIRRSLLHHRTLQEGAGVSGEGSIKVVVQVD